jgi:ADP-heptose:LPS heptosyltransferase
MRWRKFRSWHRSANEVRLATPAGMTSIADACCVLSYHVVNALLPPKGSVRENTILLIKIDAIGDYVLFRNFIELLRSFEPYKSARLTLLGNIDWKDLAEALDGTWIDDFIWLDRRRYLAHPLYRYKKLREITSRGYSTVLSPVLSRDYYGVDWLVKTVNAREKIGSSGDLHIIRARKKRLSDRWYTRLVQMDPATKFEFYRNQEFFTKLLGSPASIERPSIDRRRLGGITTPIGDYVILFIGAGIPFRKWPAERYAAVARFMAEHSAVTIVLAGSRADARDAKHFEHEYSRPVVNMVGRTSLLEMAALIAGCNFVVSNETSAPHLAVALGKTVIVISNGNHYGRFTPYPREMHTEYRAIFHPELDEARESRAELIRRYGDGSRLDIRDISTERVVDAVRGLLSARKN